MKRRRRNPYRVSKWAVAFVLTMGAGLFSWYVWHNHAISEAKQWPTTDAIVVISQDISKTNIVETDFGTDAIKQHNAAFKFSYAVAGRQYTSSCFYVYGQPRAEIVAKDYPPGRRFMARYNPKAPGDAVVEPGFANHALGFLSVMSLGLAVGFVIYNKYQT